MNLVVDYKNVVYDELKVNINKYSITRDFEFLDINNEFLYEIGDIVIIENESEELLLEGVIESIVSKDNNIYYYGRNNLKSLLYNYTDKTIKFEKGTLLDTMIKEVCSNVDVTVIGSASGLSKHDFIINNGTRLSDCITELAKYTGSLLTYGTDNQIYINHQPELDDLTLQVSQNVEMRTYSNTLGFIYNKYKIVTLETEGSDSIEQGDREKVIYYDLDLTASECKNIAKLFLLLEKNRKINYTLILDSTLNININKKYSIIDTEFNLETAMVSNNIEYFKSSKGSYILVGFENE